MKPITFKKAEFLLSATDPKHFPYIRGEGGNPIAEIAFVGRSNVGKSSLINHLFEQKQLARVSSTPGKTQLINFFQADDRRCMCVDLPGYGYAKVPLQEKKKWGPMIQGYLENREGLRAVIFLIDIRRELNEDDEQLLKWLVYYQKPTIFVFTKVDKVNQSEKHAFTKRLVSQLHIENPLYTYYSVPKNFGRDKLIQMINDLLSSPSA